MWICHKEGRGIGAATYLADGTDDHEEGTKEEVGADVCGAVADLCASEVHEIAGEWCQREQEADQCPDVPVSASCQMVKSTLEAHNGVGLATVLRNSPLTLF